MKTYTFRVSQDLEAYYNAEISVKASSEKAAINKINKMTQKQLENLAVSNTSWRYNYTRINKL